jgi:hypothetical protein
MIQNEQEIGDHFMPEDNAASTGFDPEIGARSGENLPACGADPGAHLPRQSCVESMPSPVSWEGRTPSPLWPRRQASLTPRLRQTTRS